MGGLSIEFYIFRRIEGWPQILIKEPPGSTSNIFFIAHRKVFDTQNVGYFAAKVADGAVVLLELTFKEGVDACAVCIKAQNPAHAPLIQTLIRELLAK